MTAHSAMYARSGYRQATGELAPDWDAPRNWEAPYWTSRAEAALKTAGEILRRHMPEERAAALLETFWSAIPDSWMIAQPWRYLALSAEALRNYLLHLPIGQQPDVATMIEVYRNRRQLAG